MTNQASHKGMLNMLTCFLPLTLVLLHCITKRHTSVGEGRYRFLQLNPQTVLEKHLNGPALESVVIPFCLFDILRKLLQRLLGNISPLKKYCSTDGRLIDGKIKEN